VNKGSWEILPSFIDLFSTVDEAKEKTEAEAFFKTLSLTFIYL
jgi:hypothetical protein